MAKKKARNRPAKRKSAKRPKKPLRSGKRPTPKRKARKPVRAAKTRTRAARPVKKRAATRRRPLQPPPNPGPCGASPPVERGRRVLTDSTIPTRRHRSIWIHGSAATRTRGVAGTVRSMRACLKSSRRRRRRQPRKRLLQRRRSTGRRQPRPTRRSWTDRPPRAGLEYQDAEELHHRPNHRRDKHRWALDPASSEVIRTGRIEELRVRKLGSGN